MCLTNSGPDYLIKLELYHLGILFYFNFDFQVYRKIREK